MTVDAVHDFDRAIELLVDTVEKTEEMLQEVWYKYDYVASIHVCVCFVFACLDLSVWICPFLFY